MLMYEVTAAPLIVDSSFVTWTRISMPGRSGGRLSPSFQSPRCSIRAPAQYSFSGMKPWRPPPNSTNAASMAWAMLTTFAL